MNFLHKLREGNTYRKGHVYPFLCILQLQNYKT